MSKKQQKNLMRIITAAILMVALHFITATGWLRFCLYMIPYLVVGYDILIKAVKGIKNRQPLDECLLMVIATLGAIVLALIDTGDYTEAVAVMLFYQIGEWFQSYAIDRSRRNIGELMDIRPDYANIRKEDGSLTKVDPDEVEIGTVIVCQPGEKVPIDGIVIKGHSSLDTKDLTGESKPRAIGEGDEIISGSINMTGLLEIRTTKEFGESTVSKILDLVENASSRKSKSEDFISKFARIYTPVVVGCAVALAVLPPIIRIVIGMAPVWGTWIYRALIFLVISCPCALVISIPLSFFAGIGGASRAGILIKGSNYLEALSEAETVVCDKTGTLTEGVFKVVGIYPQNITEDDLLEYAALAESASSHPIAKSLIEEYLERTKVTSADHSRVSDIEELSGLGIKANIDGKKIAIGNDKLMTEEGIEIKPSQTIGTTIYLAIDGSYTGEIVISDVIKPTTADAVRELKKSGIKKIVMLTGDDEKVARGIASELGISDVFSQLLPTDKVNKVEELLSERKGAGSLVFVGDGVNDAPVLSRADIGIAMGAMGSDAAIEAADIVLMDDDPLKIVRAIKIARKCLRIVKENIWFAIGVKIICLILGALGFANMWLAIFADVGVMVIAVLNAIRALF